VYIPSNPQEENVATGNKRFEHLHSLPSGKKKAARSYAEPRGMHIESNFPAARVGVFQTGQKTKENKPCENLF
jgi:hypothetical protein